MAGTVLAESGHRAKAPALIATAHPGPIQIKVSRTAARIHAPARRPRDGSDTVAATGYDSIWAAARARHPEPVVYAGTEDRGIDCDHLKCIALTFDDGPSPVTTDGLLETLAVEHVRATLFVVGS